MASAPSLNTPAVSGDSRLRWVLPGFILAEIATRLLLLVGNSGPLRIVFRFGVFGSSLALLFLLPWRGRRHPSSGALLWVMIVVGFALLNPQTNTLLSGMAQAMMYLAILSPAWWVPRLAVDEAIMRRTIILLWLFYALSASFGVLQVYFPGRFQPPLSPVVQALGAFKNGLKIQLANGKYIYRPMGLTDTPGGAGVAGLWTILFGLGLTLTTQTKSWLKAVALGSMSVGVLCILLCQIRSVMVMLAIMMAVLAGTMAWRQQWMRLARWAMLLVVLLGGSYLWALQVGGSAITQRLQTLTGSHGKSQKQNLYEVDRGEFLQDTFSIFMAKYPFGAGLGRWGMMNIYFGTQNNPNSKPLYSEIQWSSWLFDGGVPLMALYTLAIFLAMLFALRMSADRRISQDLNFWALIVLAYNIACFADCFDYTYFAGQSGMMFWFLNSMIFTVWLQCRKQKPRRQTPPGSAMFWPQTWQGWRPQPFNPPPPAPADSVTHA